MPPRVASGRGGAGRGNAPARGGGGFRGRGGLSAATGARGGNGLPDTSGHITTIGVKRPAFGQSGRALSVWTNHFEVKIPEANIHHYDVISPSEKALPARLNMEIIERLQTLIAPDVFTPRAVYDGRKNLFAARELPFPSGSAEFSFTLAGPASAGEGGQEGGEGKRGPKVYKVKLTHVATINPEVLARFLKGKQSHDNSVLTAITALNVVIRMEPTMLYPFNVRSFFTNKETADIGGGIVLWRGYFQSVRPAIGRMLINVDISTAAMYKSGSVIDVALDFLSKRHPNALAPKLGFPEREIVKLQRFLSGVRVHVALPGQSTSSRRPPRAIKRLTRAGANQLSFTTREGKSITVAQYFKQTHNYKLHYGDIVCIELGSGAIIPMECCTIPEGQIMRMQVPPEKTKDVLNFATKKPHERLQSIRAALGVLNYGQSEYVRQFDMHVSNTDVQSLQARVLDPPTLMYGSQSRQPTITPRDGAWNMIDKKFYKPAVINRWCIVVFERLQRFNMDAANDMVKNFLETFAAVGIKVTETDPIKIWERPGDGDEIKASLKNAGGKVVTKHGDKGGPDLMIVVLPESSTDMYHGVKHFGDITQGVATQCLRSSKCFKATKQYYANVCLKINPKLGGINAIPEARSVPVLSDPRNPTIVMGADVIHPAPGADGRPSFTALVANVDSENARYIADCRVQEGRQEMIEDLEAMATEHIRMYKQYRQFVEKKPNPDPKRLLFFRDGVSEGQFQHVKEFELPQLKRALANQNVNAKITVIVVGKRHHVRFFPQRRDDADRSGNCPAGTVVDRDITHPTDVLYDENGFTPDALQTLSFTLCHVYARSTRSVSIPAPVYYADIVCARAKNHYSPDREGRFDLGELGTQLGSADAERQLEAFRANFKRLHANTKKVMYFS